VHGRPRGKLHGALHRWRLFEVFVQVCEGRSVQVKVRGICLYTRAERLGQHGQDIHRTFAQTQTATYPSVPREHVQCLHSNGSGLMRRPGSASDL